MSRPQTTVTVTPALARRGTPTPTGSLFMVYAGAAGPTTPAAYLTQSSATTAGVPDAQAQWIADALTTGAPEVIAVRAAAADPDAVTQAEWAAGLATLTAEFGVGQVIIPGVSTDAAWSALLAHADSSGRTVLLDAASDADAATLATDAAALAASDGAERATIIAPWVTVPVSGGTTRDVPGSVFAAGLAARGDAALGHANHMPAGDQGRDAGVVSTSSAITVTYTDAELDDLHDAGVSVFRRIGGVTMLYGWRSLSDDTRFTQLNWGRMAMQLADGVSSVVAPYLFRQIDGQGGLFAEVEGALRGYLAPLWADGALYGATAEDAYDVVVADLNTEETIAAGQLVAAVEVSLSAATERVVINVVTSNVTSVA
ncbi:hypothetical protein [Nocardioides sp. GY 10127]|uniref:hypothetical protein n=1 Tax=Nocardioides sp. GY 10127 TaxID=2569762 RepID=UPI0014586063|nr:hypothetical protein [Nocardioides sp. GY 10127]